MEFLHIIAIGVVPRKKRCQLINKSLFLKCFIIVYQRTSDASEDQQATQKLVDPLQGQWKELGMRRVLMAAAAAAAIGITTPATAAVTLTDYSGADLATMIKASTTNTVNDVNTVWGCTQNDGACANVTFTGLKADQIALNAIHITDGAGFASITDAGGPNELYNIVIDLTAADFNQYMFSIQLVNDGAVSVFYMLASGGGWQGPTPSPGLNQNANANNTYLLQGGTFTQIWIASTSPIKEFKQNSVTLGSTPAPVVPEPATWALMLLGFGGIGFALRRGRRQGNVRMMQIA
jgi:uncharacterized protein (DUF2141 family)